MPEQVIAWKVGRVYYSTEEAAVTAERQLRIVDKAEKLFANGGMPHIPYAPDAHIVAWWIADNAKLLREILSA